MMRFKKLMTVVIVIAITLATLYSQPVTITAATAISPLEYAKMSQAAYNDGGGGAPTGWEIIDSESNLSYFGVAYRNAATGNIVIAHRGTALSAKAPVSSFGDIVADIQLTFDEVPYQFSSAKKLASRVKANYPTATIYQTGHSLGATLAELTARYFGTSATTFDSPGSASIASGGVGTASITSYQAAPNAINTINPHLGTLILLDTNWDKMRAAYLSTLAFVVTISNYVDEDLSLIDVIKFIGSAYAKYTMNAHSIERIVSLFDPGTGSPRQSAVVTDWPRGVYAGLAKFLVGDAASGSTLEALAAALVLAASDDLFVRLIVIYTISASAPLDLVFVIDTTGSMGDDIDAVKAAATTVVGEVAVLSTDYRIAVVLYKDAGDIYTSTVLQPFTSNTAEIVSSIQSISVGGGGDTPEAVFSGLMTAINLPYRKGVNKQLILMGDAPPKNPDPAGYTSEDVLRAAWEVDPGVINTLQIGFDGATAAAFQDLARGSRGLTFTAADASEIVPKLLQLIHTIPQPTPNQSVFVVDGPPGELCSSMDGSQNATVRVTGSVPDGQVFCKVIASNGNIPNPAQIGNSDVLNKGVLSAVDVYAFAANGQSVTKFSGSMQLCLLGQGSMFMLSANQTPRVAQQLPALQQGGYTCSNFSEAGTFVLTSGGAPMPAAVASQQLVDCFVSTKAILNLRSEPSTSSGVIAQLPYNEFRYTATEYVPGWYRIIYQDTQGWVNEHYLFVYGTCQRR